MTWKKAVIVWSPRLHGDMFKRLPEQALHPPTFAKVHLVNLNQQGRPTDDKAYCGLNLPYDDVSEVSMDEILTCQRCLVKRDREMISHPNMAHKLREED